MRILSLILVILVWKGFSFLIQVTSVKHKRVQLVYVELLDMFLQSMEWVGRYLQRHVYSYGIFLLELFSGKRPTESSILVGGCSNIHDYVRKVIPRRVMDIADARTVLDQEEHGLTVNQSHRRAILEVCLTSIFEVGILCSEETPRKRIDIVLLLSSYMWQKTDFCSAGNNLGGRGNRYTLCTKLGISMYRLPK